MKNSENLSEIRKTLSSLFNDLVNDNIDYDKARIVSKMADSINANVKIQLGYNVAKQKYPDIDKIEFIEKSK